MPHSYLVLCAASLSFFPSLPPCATDLLNAWVWTLSVKQWEDVALVNDPSLMDQLDCTKYSNGQVSSGWNCLFSPMPHLCEFNSTEVSARVILSACSRSELFRRMQATERMIMHRYRYSCRHTLDPVSRVPSPLCAVVTGTRIREVKQCELSEGWWNGRSSQEVVLRVICSMLSPWQVRLMCIFPLDARVGLYSPR